MRRMRFVGLPVVLFGLVFLAIVGLLVTVLWNVLMPPVLGLHPIGFWQALGLFLLSRLLFGRFGGWGRRMHRARFVRGWNELTPDERRRFRCGLRGTLPGDPREPETEGKA